MCPTGRFTATLTGSTVSFDASKSSTPLPGRHIAMWIWNFGDGHTRTTSGPKVTHTSPAAPLRARTAPPAPHGPRPRTPTPRSSNAVHANAYWSARPSNGRPSICSGAT
ncbi:MAG: PKD domain-containing protein [Streptosporangiaceae bacterium]